MHTHEIVRWVIARGEAFIAAYPGESLLLFVGAIVSMYLVSISKPR